MKRLLLALVVVSMAIPALAHETPTVYGKINKEIRYVDQKTKFHYKKFNNVVDVDNSETRLGAKHEVEFDGMKAKGTVEIGLNSTTTASDADERLRMRLAKIDLSGNFGTFTFGKDYTAVANTLSKIDPMSGSGVGFLGKDQQNDVKNIKDNLGTWNRTRKNLIGYATPVFAGFQIATTLDRNDSMDRSTNPAGAEYWETLLTYKGEFGNMKPEVFFGYIKELGTYQASTADASGFPTISKENSMIAGANLGIQDFTIGLAYQNRNLENKLTAAATAKKQKENWMSGFLKYNMNKNFAALTYVKHDYDLDGTNAGKYADSQIALGYNHVLGEHLIAKVSYAMLEHKEKAESATDTTRQNNKANMFMVGGELNF